MVELGGAAADPRPGQTILTQIQARKEGARGQQLRHWATLQLIGWPYSLANTPKSRSPFLILLKEWTVMKTRSPAHFRKECGEKKSLFIEKKNVTGSPDLATAK